MKDKIKLTYIASTALVVWFGLILQFYISIEKYLTEGWTLGGAFVQVISYFTIQTNILVAVALTSLLLKPKSSWGVFFSRISVLTAITVYITIVGLIYAVILKGLWKPEGLFKLADFLLHTLSPILFVVLWFVFLPKGNIKWKQLFLWAIFPIYYLIYSLIRGAFVGLYPYGFIDAGIIGYNQVMINSLMVLIVFLVISSILIAVNNFLKKP